MLKKQFCSFLLKGIFLVFVLPTRLFCMEVAKFQLKKGNTKETSRNNSPKKKKRRSICRICYTPIDKEDEAKSLKCLHSQIIHERCFKKRTAPCKLCSLEDYIHERAKIKNVCQKDVASSIQRINSTINMSCMQKKGTERR